MVVVGVILLVIGLIVSSASWLVWVGLILIVVGLVLNFMPVGGTRRRVW